MSENNEKVKKEKKLSYKRIILISKMLAPILKLIYYVLIVGILLCGIVALILLFINTAPKDMLLPPFMTYDGELEQFQIIIGNGIYMQGLEDVTTSDIKTVMYAQLMLLATFFAIAAPICLFLSKLMKNFTGTDPFDLKNARLMIYIGLTVIVGQTFMGIIDDFYNYLLVNTFVTDSYLVQYAFTLPLNGIFMGILIIICAHFYGNACERHKDACGTPGVVQK